MSPFLATFLIRLLGLLSGILQILELIVLISVIVSWLIRFDVINVRNRTVYQIVSALDNVSERLLYPIRRFIPGIAGLDFSPLIFLFLCEAVRTVLIPALGAQIVAMARGY